MIESVTPKDKKLRFEFIAAIPKEVVGHMSFDRAD